MSLLRDEEDGHLVGIEQKPIKKAEFAEYPKYVVPHEGQIVRLKVEGARDHISVPAFPEFHVSRQTGEVTVLVMNEEQAKAASEAPHQEEHPEPDAELRSDVAPLLRT